MTVSVATSLPRQVGRRDDYAAILRVRGVSISSIPGLRPRVSSGLFRNMLRDDYGATTARASSRRAMNSSRSQAFSSRSTLFSNSLIAVLLSALRKRRMALSWT